MIATFIVALALAQQPPREFSFEKEFVKIEFANTKPRAGDVLMVGDPNSGEKYPIAPDFLAVSNVYKYLLAKDSDGLKQLEGQGHCMWVEPGLVKVIKLHDYRSIKQGHFAEVRFIKGPYADRTVYTVAAFLGLYIERYKELPIEFYARGMEIKPAGVAVASITSDLAESLGAGEVKRGYEVVRRGKGVLLKPGETYTVERMNKECLILKVEIGKKRRDVYILPKFVQPTDDTIAKYREGKSSK